MILYYYCPLWLVFVKVTRTLETSNFLANNENKNFIGWMHQQTQKKEGKTFGQNDPRRPITFNLQNIISGMMTNFASQKAVEPEANLRQNRVFLTPTTNKKFNEIVDKRVQRQRSHQGRGNISESSSSSESERDDVYQFQNFINNMERRDNNYSSDSPNSARKSAERAMAAYNDWDRD